MELSNLFEGSLEEHLPAAVEWCSTQHVANAADIVEAGLGENFAREVLGGGAGLATPLQARGSSNMFVAGRASATLAPH